ncbi:hypothetical protein [Vibrio barjaei]|uniref:hypothetical protein n=1 Tax=Vibrio barjaei TaxID=1676683 RepID=UPI0022838777|nr:hypothetical protein [Vibrio barjaei]MCY9870353.1 hypothetical protein [Vibrio barjaei]
MDNIGRKQIKSFINIHKKIVDWLSGMHPDHDVLESRVIGFTVHLKDWEKDSIDYTNEQICNFIGVNGPDLESYIYIDHVVCGYIYGFIGERQYRDWSIKGDCVIVNFDDSESVKLDIEKIEELIVQFDGKINSYNDLKTSYENLSS